MKVLIAYPFTTSGIRVLHQIIYLPELVQSEESLLIAIREHHPNVIIVGNNSVGEKTLETWRSMMGDNILLTLIRRGSSLSRIKIDRAKQLNINVLNTLSVNSRFVAEYMIEHLNLSNNKDNLIIAIIGSGAIGRRVAYRLNQKHHIVNIYSPSLIEPDEYIRKKIQKEKGIDLPGIHIYNTPEEAVQNATHVILAVDADKVKDDNERLSQEFFQLISNGARLVSVTEFHVFVQGALHILIERIKKGELTAHLDSHAYDLSEIKDHPDGLVTISAAMKGRGCGEVMDQAALVVLANIALEQSLNSSLIFPKNSQEKTEDITIIGAGIMGLVTALFLCENGYKITIIDEHNRPNLKNDFNENEISCRGPTLDGCDARHASITETLPHAVFYRINSLIKYPNDHGGWKIIPEHFSNEEKPWIERFCELAGHPELVVYLFNKFVSNLNRCGMELWENIFQNYPQIAKNCVKNHRIIRVCPSLTLLNVVSQFQTKYHNNQDNLQRLTHAQVLQRIPSLILKDGDAGGIDVPGFTVNHQHLCSNIIQYLETKQNVKFKWSTHIRSIDDISSSKIIFASSLNGIDCRLLENIPLAIQGVLGCWTKVPNINSIKIGFKIMEKEPIGVINVTPSEDEQHLYITGGFAFCGHRGIVQSKYLDQLIELFNSTIRNYLPDEIEASESKSHPTKFCIRPMTPDGMPIIQEFSSQNKKQDIYFIGGTNSAGFVQSPILATLLLDLFKGTTSDSSFCHIYRSLRLDRQTLIFNSNSTD
ncbi:unnamed protein product [Adineta steineri]|uniref:FAD dependent oxidoreductase domain-containing protein n=1 Tax=Adineta steineri TaxID=433720 RepID=A0A813SL21_9BILA|nr:unnamed protein product [Adineta steineri]